MVHFCLRTSALLFLKLEVPLRQEILPQNLPFTSRMRTCLRNLQLWQFHLPPKVMVLWCLFLVIQLKRKYAHPQSLKGVPSPMIHMGHQNVVTKTDLKSG
uniref:Uncharacterized protein n=1 Tax=Zea mays TaxID=4577 RepID=C4J882_MAIZE|nr:unknown [Zea mays]|eukprot:NP_001183542.1 uncharacterized protein LOC100502081 [Zea mays]